MTDRHWEHVPDDADVGGGGAGPTRETSFEDAVRAFTAAP